MIGHQAPALDPDPIIAAMGDQKIAVEAVVLLAEERRRPAIAALGDMMGKAGKNNTCQTSHDPSLTEPGRQGN